MPNVTWSRDTAAHLLRRAGFGSTKEELDRYTAMGLDAAVDTLVDYESVSNAALENALAQYNFDFERGPLIQAWWLLRMLYTARPLEEKMVFFWHNYFATSIAKAPPPLMKAQNDLFRRYAVGNFHDMLVDVSKDPAMLIWLDNIENRVGKPNENYARELMELFTTGIGHYTETDVQEVARCFTGWSLRQDVGYFFVRGAHDDGPKTFLGVSVPAGGGESDGLKVCEVLAAHPATAQYLTRRLFDEFAYRDAPEATIDKFADVYTSSGYSIRAVMRAILTSDEFYSEKSMFGNVKSPTEYVIGSLKALGARVDVRTLAADIASMGQFLLVPPDVFGWDGGLAWVNTTNILARDDFGNRLATNRTNAEPPRGHYVDVNALLEGGDFSKANKLLTHMLDVLGPIELSKERRKPLKNYLVVDDRGVKQEFRLDATTVDKKVRGLIHLIMTLPEYSLN